jgi:hypothetical protein
VSRITTTAHDLARKSRRAQGLPDSVEDQMALMRIAALVRVAQAASHRGRTSETAASR